MFEQITLWEGKLRWDGYEWTGARHYIYFIGALLGKVEYSNDTDTVYITKRLYLREDGAFLIAVLKGLIEKEDEFIEQEVRQVTLEQLTEGEHADCRRLLDEPFSVYYMQQQQKQEV